MNFRPYFSEWANEVDRFLFSRLAQRVKTAQKATPIAGDLVSDFADFIVGGKRLRAGLVRLGYETFGGRTPKKILPIAAAVEIVHGGMLVHDDIIDRGETRHNKPTLHERYKKRQVTDDQTEALHYGEGMAICAGDIAFFETIKLCLTSVLPIKVKERVISELLETLFNTAYGQTLDLELGYKSKVTKREILTVYRLKTALYTFVGPLSYGAIGAKASKRELAMVVAYGLPVGIAFQLQDDILGMFGDEKTLGKPIDSDIKEGKKTLLYLEAFKRSTLTQRRFLARVWGNPEITPKEVGQARKIIKDTGSLDHEIKLARQLVAKGKRVIPKLTKNPEYQEIFSTLADYIIEREK